jgi:hypothetical protein
MAGAPVVVEGLDSPEVGSGGAVDEAAMEPGRAGWVYPSMVPNPLKAKRAARVDPSDLYVLFREHGSGRLPFLLAWINRHGLTAGYSERHARKFSRVLVVGQPDGLLLDGCDVSYVRAEHADALFRTLPAVQSFFGRENGL